VSAYVSFEVFVRPAIRRMIGVTPVHRPVIRAVCAETMQSPGGKRQFARGFVETKDDEAFVRPVGGAGSHLLGDLAQANCFIVVPEDVTDVAAGDDVDVMVLDRLAS
jgi:molybdopterin molybdotransferase